MKNRQCTIELQGPEGALVGFSSPASTDLGTNVWDQNYFLDAGMSSICRHGACIEHFSIKWFPFLNQSFWHGWRTVASAIFTVSYWQCTSTQRFDVYMHDERSI